MKEIAFLWAIVSLLFVSACGPSGDTTEVPVKAQPSVQFAPEPQPAVSRTPPFPDLQAELTDGRYKNTSSPLGQFEFKNHLYPLPRGWQNPDGADLQLSNGRVTPVSLDIHEDMSDEEKVERRAARRIGMSHVITKYMDLTGDGQDEAVVILKVETTGAAIPQLVYVYEWKDEKPNLIWNFRTGDRADGGLKDIRVENGEPVIELYGQDRFILGEVETGKITGDEEQLCCPTYFTRTFYRWNGADFLLNKKRLTYSVEDPSAPPLENYGEVVNAQEKAKR